MQRMTEADTYYSNMKNLLLLLAMCLGTAGTQAQTRDSIRTLHIIVGNLHCNNDMPTIKKQLLNREGIDEVSFTEIKGDRSEFRISYHSSVTRPEEIEAAIESTPGCDDPDSRPYKVKRPKKKRS